MKKTHKHTGNFKFCYVTIYWKLFYSHEKERTIKNNNNKDSNNKISEKERIWRHLASLYSRETRLRGRS